MSRIAIIHKEKCNPKSCSKVCARFCPMNRAGKQCIVIEAKAGIDESICIIGRE